jgi:uncharacterized protein YdhG (YjbR/CyaY superfamily)
MLPKNIDDYIAMQPQAFHETLHQLRAIIKSAAPEAEEVISYQLPAFKYHYMLVSFGASKQYCSLYTMSSTLTKTMKDELKGVKVSGTTLHFEPGTRLPVSLIKKIVKIRLNENKERAMMKKSSRKN